MIYGLAMGLFIFTFIVFLAFIRLCEWVLSRREVNS